MLRQFMAKHWTMKLLPFRNVPLEYRHLLDAVKQLAAHPDPVFREFALRRSAAIAEELRDLAAGEIVFLATETWRATYERILQSLSFSLYRSVSWVRSPTYWHDLPGQQSIRLNYELLDSGLRIERVFIIGPNLWPLQDSLPRPCIRDWLEEQHYRGIAVSLVRESDLQQEEDLLRDFGIYGDRAAGEQELDEESRTLRFVLRFDQCAIHLASDRWDRLQLFAIPYGDLLDRAATAV